MNRSLLSLSTALVIFQAVVTGAPTQADEHTYQGPPNLALWTYIQDRPDGYLGSVKAARTLAVYLNKHHPNHEGTFEAGVADAEYLWLLSRQGMKHLEEYGRLGGTQWNWPLYEPQPRTGLTENVWEEGDDPLNSSPSTYDGRFHLGYARSGVLFYRNYVDFFRHAGLGSGVSPAVTGWNKRAGTGSGVSYSTAMSNILAYYLDANTHGQVTLTDYSGTARTLLLWPSDSVSSPLQILFGGRTQQNGIPTVLVDYLSKADKDGHLVEPSVRGALEETIEKGTWATVLAARVFDGDGDPSNDAPAYNGNRGDEAYWHDSTDAGEILKGNFNVPVNSSFQAGRCVGLAGAAQHLLEVAAYFRRPTSGSKPELVAACEEVVYDILETLQNNYRLADPDDFQAFAKFSTRYSIGGADQGIGQGGPFSDPANARYWFDIQGNTPADHGTLRLGQGRGIAGPLWLLLGACQYEDRYGAGLLTKKEQAEALEFIVRGSLFMHDVMFPVADRHGRVAAWCPITVASDSQVAQGALPVCWSLNSCKGPYSTMVYLASVWELVLDDPSLFSDTFFRTLHAQLTRQSYLKTVRADVDGILNHLNMLQTRVRSGDQVYGFWWNTQNGLPGENQEVYNSLVSPGSLSFGQAGPAIACIKVAEILRRHDEDPGPFETVAIEVLRFLDWAAEVNPEGRLGSDQSGTVRWFCHLERTKNLPGPHGGIPRAPVIEQVRQDQGSLILSWRAQASDERITGYHVFRSTDTRGPFLPLTHSPIKGMGWVDDQVTAGVRYYYRITAVDENTNEGPFSKSVSEVAL